MSVSSSRESLGAAVRVLHLFKRLDHGGAEMRTLERLRYPAMAGVESHVCLLGDGVGALESSFRNSGAVLHRCRFDARFPARFARLVRDVRPDVVHANQQWMSAVLLAYARVLGVPGRVCQFHASSDLVQDTLFRRLRNRALRRLMGASATAITGVSEGVMACLWYPNWRSSPRCSVEYLGIDLSRYVGERGRAELRHDLGISQKSLLAIHVGNMVAAKNHVGLGELFAALSRRCPDLHLLSVGRRDSVIEGAMRHAAGPHRDRLHVLGARNDVPRLLLGCDLFVMPSVSEGLPTALLEARAAGLPAVVTGLPGNLEVVQRLTRVQCLPLSGWGRWVEACEQALQTPPDPLEPNPLVDTVFDGAASAEAHAALWRRSMERAQ